MFRSPFRFGGPTCAIVFCQEGLISSTKRYLEIQRTLRLFILGFGLTELKSTLIEKMFMVEMAGQHQ